MSDRQKDRNRENEVAAVVADRRHFLPDIDIPGNLPRTAIGIADMANAFGVTHRTLHFYEEKHLIVAARAGVMRVYDLTQVKRMAIISACRETGMPVADIQDLMEALDNAPSQELADHIFLHALETRRRELTSEQSTILRQMHRLNALIGESAGLPEEANDNVAEHELTDDEQRCLMLMSEGYAPARLMRALELDAGEIAELEKNIIRKFGANNRFQAVAKAMLMGILN